MTNLTQHFDTVLGHFSRLDTCHIIEMHALSNNSNIIIPDAIVFWFQTGYLPQETYTGTCGVSFWEPLTLILLHLSALKAYTL